MRRLTERLTVSGQLTPGQMAELAGAGVRAVVNNRPDGEEPGQPSAAQIATAAKDAGLAVFSAPFQGRPGDAEVQALRDALAGGGPVHAFCRSGMRSASAWALMAAEDGEPVEAIIARGREAGYDLAPLFF